MKYIKKVASMTLCELHSSYTLAELMSLKSMDLFMKEKYLGHMNDILKEYERRFHAQVPVKVKKKSLEERKSDFVVQVRLFEQIYADQMLEQFCSWWTERGPNDKKMRFEKQASFDISRRLATWKRRSDQVSKKSNEPTLEGVWKA